MTGRNRRCGWLDLVALKYAIMINGVTDLVMMKGDVLDDFDTIKVCTAYTKDGETVLIKNLVAYRETVVNTLDGNCSKMYDVINAMRDDAKIAKHSPRLYITSNGVFVVAYDPKENDWYENRTISKNINGSTKTMNTITVEWGYKGK